MPGADVGISSTRAATHPADRYAQPARHDVEPDDERRSRSARQDRRDMKEFPETVGSLPPIREGRTAFREYTTRPSSARLRSSESRDIAILRERVSALETAEEGAAGPGRRAGCGFRRVLTVFPMSSGDSRISRCARAVPRVPPPSDAFLGFRGTRAAAPELMSNVPRLRSTSLHAKAQRSRRAEFFVARAETSTKRPWPGLALGRPQAMSR